MGGQMLGAFAAGLSSTLQQAQQRKTEQEYKKALVEQSKLQTKMLENKLALAGQEQGMMRAVAEAAGFPVPPMQQLPTQAAPQVQKQGLLQKMFGGGQPPAPAPVAPAPVQQVAAQQPITDTIAKGQMGNNPLAKDILYHKFFDLPPWREKHEAESKQVGKAVTTMGPNGPVTVIVDKMARPMEGQVYPQPPEFTYHETQPLPGGPTYTMPIPKHPGAGGVGIQPFIKEQIKGETPTTAGQSQAIIGGLQDGLKFLQVIKDPKTGQINQGTITGMTAPLMGSVGGMPGTNAREGLALYRNAVDAIVRQRTGAAIREDEWKFYDSIYLPTMLDNPQLQQDKINRLNRDLSGALIQSDPNKTRLDRSMSVGGGGSKPSLNLNQIGKTWEENGQNYRINPQTGKKQIWRP